MGRKNFFLSPGRKNSSPVSLLNKIVVNKMNINIITANQEIQNAYNPKGEAANAGTGSVTVAEQSSGEISSGEIDSPQGQNLRIALRIDNLQSQMNNMNVVHDPPFFPIATYQRVDLVLKIKNILADIEKSTLAQEIKKAVSTSPVMENVTDEQLGAAIGKLFDIRDALAQDREISAADAQPGDILKLEV